MILFQIDSTDRSFMRELLVNKLDLQGFCEDLKKNYPQIESAEFKRLSTQNASLGIDFFQGLLVLVREFLDKHFHTFFSVGTAMFDARIYDYKSDPFFWDTIIAAYMQLKYDKSTPTTMRDFYIKKLEKYGIKYDSHAKLFKDHIYGQPMGEYLNIHPRNPEKSHPRQYIRDCFPIQQYVLIHSAAKSPYCKSPSGDTIDSLFKTQEYVMPDKRYLKAAYMSSEIYGFNDAVQNICNSIFKKVLADKTKFAMHPDRNEVQIEEQLTAYIVEQAYSYWLFSWIASDPSIIDRFKSLKSYDRTLYKEISEQMETSKHMRFAHDLTPPEIVEHLPFDTQIADYIQKMDSLQKHLTALSDIVCVSAVLTRPYILANRLWDRCWVPEAYGYLLESPDCFNPIHNLAYSYIPLVQEFYLQALLWLFPLQDSKIELDRFLEALLIGNMDKWKVNNAALGRLGSTELKILGLLLEMSRTRYQTVDAIQKEHLYLDFKKRKL